MTAVKAADVRRAIKSLGLFGSPDAIGSMQWLRDIVKGYDIGSGRYLEITDDELEAITVQGTHTIEIDEFVPKDDGGSAMARARPHRNLYEPLSEAKIEVN